MMTTGNGKGDLGQNALALAVMGDGRRSRWARRLAVGLTAYQLGRSAYEWAESRRARDRYTVSVYDNDPLWYLVHDWFVAQLRPSERRSVAVRAERRKAGPEVDLTLNVDDNEWQELRVDGHTVSVQVEQLDPTASNSDGMASVGTSRLKPERIVFASRTVEARDAVVKLLHELVAQLYRQDRTSRIYTLGTWGDWYRAAGDQPRPLESVVLAGSTLADLVADVRNFISQEDRYIELGIPWHRGYVFHGPPGTGKTSTARALAGELDMDVYYVPLSDVKADTDLASVLTRIDERSMLLLEDVDVIHATRERDDRDKGITTSGLLNALDGVITPHGLLTVMTTNRLDVLDPALLRPGRADVPVHMDYLEDDQLRRLVKQFLKRDLEGTWPSVEGLELTPADVVDVIKRHLDDDDAAYREVHAYLAGEAQTRVRTVQNDGVGVR